MNNTLFEQFGDIYMQVGEYMCFIGLLQKNNRNLMITVINGGSGGIRTHEPVKAT